MAQDPIDVRLALLSSGYDPLPLRGKRPAMNAWTGVVADPQLIRLWSAHNGYPDAVNTGVLTRHTPGCDLDVLNPECAEAMEDCIREHFEERGTILSRIGLWPKRLIPFRTDEPFTKISVQLIAPDGSEQKIEFLGDGQQFAAFGIHPDTHKPYQWPRGSILEVTHEELPYIREADARALVAKLVSIALSYGYTLKNKPKTNSKGNGKDEPAPWGDYWTNAIDDDSNLKFAIALQRAGMHAGAAYNLIHAAITYHPTDDEARRRRRYHNLKGQIERAYGYIGASPTEVLESIRIDTVERQSINWLWPGRFAFGKLGIIAGLPDEGKGQLAWYIVAQATKGGEFPCGEGVAPIGNVIVLEAEDDLHDTVRPRLEAAGADLTRVHFVNMVKINGKGDKRMFNLATDLAMLRKKIEEIGGVVLIIIDPLSAYLGRTKQVDTFRSSDMRNVLTPFTELAAELGVAIIAIMHFNKKVDVTNVLLRVSDSVAITAAARHLYGVVDDRENKRKLFVRGKNNVAAYEQKTLAYSFALHMVGLDPAGEEVWAPHILWHPDPVEISATEAMQGNIGRPAEARANAEDFLEKKLHYGPMRMNDIEEHAKAEGISRATLFRAKLKLQIGSYKDGAHWVWHLPGQQPSPPQEDDQ